MTAARPANRAGSAVSSSATCTTSRCRWSVTTSAITPRSANPVRAAGGLPVLRRIVGRVRNTLVTADGRRYWPMFGMRTATDFAPVIQHQFVQKAWDLIEARLVTAAPLTAAQEDKLRGLILSRLPDGFRVRFEYRDRIERSAGGKYEDFICEVSAASR